MSFFGLSLINELEGLVQNELNKTALYSVNQKNDQSQVFASVLKSIQIPDTLKRKYVLNDIGSTTYVGMFIMVNDLNVKFSLIQLGAKVSFAKSNIVSAYIPIDQIKNVLLISGIQFVETAIPVKQNLDQARKFTNVNQVNSGIQLPKGYTGKNVLIGVIDGGFDYGHPAFYDSLGNYRVYSIWDQNDSIGVVPPNFNYGSEYIMKDDIISLETDDYSESHGTHVAGITSGANWSTTQNFKGIAYNSKLVFVSANYNSKTLFDGIGYVFMKADELKIPAIVNMSIGSHYGPHDGTSPFDKACDILLKNGNNNNFSIVGAAGNEGDEKLHINKEFTKVDTSVYTFVKFHNSREGYVDIWANNSDNLSLRVGIFNIRLNKFEFLSQKLSTLDNLDSYVVKGLSGENLFTIFTNSKEPGNSKGHIVISIDASKVINPDYRIVINLAGTDNGFHGWDTDGSKIYFDDDNLLYSDLIKGNSDYSVGEIGGTGNSIITVGAYNSGNTSETIGDKASFSSYGPTVDGRLKPNITAPGNRITSSVNSFDLSYNVGGSNFADVVKTYNYLGRQYNYAKIQGTSMSSPVVAGIIALWKEACPLISTNQIKTVLSNTAIKDQFTGTSANKYWGHGKIDAYAGIKYILAQMPTKPKLSISGDTIICSGKKLTISAPLGFKSYLWNTGDTTRTITVGDEDSYVVNVQNGMGWWSDYSDTLNVYVDSVDAIISRLKPANCLNSLYLNSNLQSGQSITWYKNDSIITGANSRQFIPQVSGIYKIKIVNNDTKCFDLSDTLIVDMRQYNNRLFKSDSIITCSTDSIILDAGAGFKMYTWNTGAKTQSITVKQTGKYSVTVSNPSGCSSTDSCFVSILKANIINNDTTICKGNSIKISIDSSSLINYLAGTTGPAGGLIFYDKGNVTNGWRYLESANTDIVGIPWWNGTLITTGATATSIGSGLQNTNTIITAQGAGNYAATAAKNYTQGDYKDWFLPSRDELNLIYQNLKVKGLGNLNNDFYWSSSEFNVNGAYRQVFTNQGGVDAGWKYFTNGTVRPVRAFAGEKLKIKWSTGDTTNFITVSPSQTTKYYCTISNGISTCVDSVTISVGVLDTSIIALDPLQVCSNNGSVRMQAGVAASYKWLKDGVVIPGATASIYTALQTGNYRVVVANSVGCSDTTRSLSVSINPLPVGSIQTPVTNIICDGSSIVLTASGGDTYQWKLNGANIPGAIDSSYAAKVAGSYTVTLINRASCSALATGNITLSLISRPAVAFSYVNNCVNVPVSFTNTSDVSKSGTVTYAWTFGNGNRSTLASPVNQIYPTVGNYNIKLVVTPAACPTLYDSLIKVINVVAPPPGIRYPSMNVLKNVATTLQARNIGTTFTWNPVVGLSNGTISNPVFNFNVGADYQINIVNTAGCKIVDSLLIRVFDKYSVFVPKAFSPDGNGVNDLLRPILVGIKEVRSFRVYSRWGNLLYQTKAVTLGWDGTYNGQLMPTDTYTWVFEGVDLDNKPVLSSGKSTLIR
jgi:gliding motility-associated-like protein